jgi:hypothetical protein
MPRRSTAPALWSFPISSWCRRGTAGDSHGSGRSGHSPVPGRSRSSNSVTRRARSGRRREARPGAHLAGLVVPMTCGPVRRPALQLQRRCPCGRRLEASSPKGVTNHVLRPLRHVRVLRVTLLTFGRRASAEGPPMSTSTYPPPVAAEQVTTFQRRFLGKVLPPLYPSAVPGAGTNGETAAASATTARHSAALSPVSRRRGTMLCQGVGQDRVQNRREPAIWFPANWLQCHRPRRKRPKSHYFFPDSVPLFRPEAPPAGPGAGPG